MIHDISIRLAGKTYRLSAFPQLPSLNQLTGYAQLPSYAQEALQFCHQWVQGVESFVQHTSGSTGTPKPIEISRKQMQESAHMTISALGLKAGDKALVCLGANYIAGKMMLVRAMEAGMDLIIVQPSSLPLRGVSDPVDFMAVVPLQLKSMLDEEQPQLLEQLNRMKAIIVGGGAVSSELEKSIYSKLKSPVYSTYGMTESVSHIALRRLNTEKASELYQVLPGIEVKTDRRGCLMVRGAVTRHHWLTTNDMVKMEGQKYFRWLGRADNVINSGGLKIHTELLEKELESGIQLLGRYRQFFVAGLPDEMLGERVTLFVEGEHPPSEKMERFYAWTRERFPFYKQPREVFFCSKFLLTSTGKLRRKASIELAMGNS